MYVRIISILVLSVCLFTACKTDKKSAVKPAAKNVTAPVISAPNYDNEGINYNWLKNSNIYEINTRQFSKAGDFKSILRHLPRLANMGVDIINLMPIFPISKKNRVGSHGSPDASTNFTGINSDYGSKDDFKILIDSIHQLKMRVLLDINPSVTGLDCKWLKEFPNWYQSNTSETKDVALLNYKNADLSKSMKSVFDYWIDQYKIDGYIVHDASKLPTQFWKETSTSLFKKKQKVFMISREQNSSLIENKYFQATYGTEFHSLLNDISSEKKSAKDVKKWFAKNEGNLANGLQIHYTSDNESNATTGSEFERMPESHKCMAALSYTLNGMPLIYNGQEEPILKRLSQVNKDEIGFRLLSYEEFYRRLNRSKHLNQALWNSSFTSNPTFIHVDEQLLIFEKKKGSSEVVCIFNLSNKRASYKIHRNLDMWEDVVKSKRWDFPKDYTIQLEPWTHYIISNR